MHSLNPPDSLEIVMSQAEFIIVLMSHFHVFVTNLCACRFFFFFSIRCPCSSIRGFSLWIPS
jgi:hypothetical protein